MKKWEIEEDMNVRRGKKRRKKPKKQRSGRNGNTRRETKTGRKKTKQDQTHVTLN